MPATSVAVHEPSATSSSSTGEGPDERCELVSSTSARPPGVMPTKRSSATNFTTALPVVDINQLRRKNNTAKISVAFRVMIRARQPLSFTSPKKDRFKGDVSTSCDAQETPLVSGVGGPSWLTSWLLMTMT